MLTNSGVLFFSPLKSYHSNWDNLKWHKLFNDWVLGVFRFRNQIKLHIFRLLLIFIFGEKNHAIWFLKVISMEFLSLPDLVTTLGYKYG